MSLLVQYIFGVFVLKFDFGFELFRFFGDTVEKFLAFTDTGSRVVFGENFDEHFFIFKVNCFKKKFYNKNDKEII